MTDVVLIAPDGMSSFSIAGVEMIITGGEFTIDDKLVDDLTPHGFRRKVRGPLTGKKSVMVNNLYGPARAVLESLSDDVLLRFSALSDADQEKFFAHMKKKFEEYPATIASERDAAEKAAAEKAAAESKAAKTKN